MKKSLIALAVAGLVASTAMAATPAREARAAYLPVQYEQRWDGNPRDDERQMQVDERQSRLANRIERGFENGRLTRPEARRLHDQLRHIEAKQRAFESDGRLGPREQAELQDDMDRLAARIRHQARDEDRRF